MILTPVSFSMPLEYGILTFFTITFCWIYIFFFTSWPGLLAYSESRILLILLAFRRLNVAPDFDQ